MSERWIEYLMKEKEKHHSLLKYAVNHWGYNMPLYCQIKKAIKPPAKILEVGCGYGLSAIYLQESGYHVTAVDNYPKIIDLARQSAECFHSDVTIELVDAYNLSKYYHRFNLVFSIGVIEHFSKEQTIELLKEQAKCAEYVIAVIPTKNTKYSGRITDEHFYSMKQFANMFKEANMNVIGKFGYGDVPTVFHRILRFGLSPIIYCVLQCHFSLGMDIACLGRSKEKR